MTTTVTGARSAADIYASLNPQSTNATTGKEDTQDRFLKLYVTQLRNQDPLNPMDNAQVTTQLAQLNTVRGIETLNSTLTRLMEAFTGSQTLQAAAMIGKSVLVPGSHLSLADGQAHGGVDLPQAVERVTVRVEDANGLAMRTLELGPQEAGSVVFAWNGLTDGGAFAADGNYRFKVTAVGGGKAATATALEIGTVHGVVRSGSSFELDLGTSGIVGMNDVRRIL